MTFDPSKLAPAPWRVETDATGCAVIAGKWPDYTLFIGDLPLEEAALIALIRNALDVQARRGWGMERLKEGKWVLLDHSNGGWLFIDGRNWIVADPYQAMAALVEADKCCADHGL